MTIDRAIAFVGLAAGVVSVVWFFGRAFVMLGRDNVLGMLRDPPFLLALLGFLLMVASYLL